MSTAWTQIGQACGHRADDRQMQRAGRLDERIREHEPDQRRKRELHDRHEPEVGLDFAGRRAPLLSGAGTSAPATVTTAAANSTGT